MAESFETVAEAAAVDDAVRHDHRWTSLAVDGDVPSLT